MSKNVHKIKCLHLTLFFVIIFIVNGKCRIEGVFMSLSDFNVSWFTIVPGLLITGGVVLLLFALILSEIVKLLNFSMPSSIE